MKQLKTLFENFYTEYSNSMVKESWKALVAGGRAGGAYAAQILNRNYNAIYVLFLAAQNNCEFVAMMQSLINRSSGQEKEILNIFIEYYKLNFAEYCKNKIPKTVQKTTEVPKWQIELDKINKIINKK